MAYDYDTLYGTTPQALGEPTQVFVDFFNSQKMKSLRVLDIGCGQGRDALYIARMGHHVVGVDLSPNGIRDLNKTAKMESLDVEGSVADIVTYTPEGSFDVVLIDRTLHMLPKVERLAVLARLLTAVNPLGWVLIADERSNINGFKNVAAAHSQNWAVELEKGGTFFLKRS